MLVIFFFFFKQKTAYEMRISDWSSDVCSSDLRHFQDAGVLLVLSARSRGAESARRRCIGRLHLRRPHSVVGRKAEATSPRGCPLRQRISEAHTSELQSLIRNSYAVFCLKRDKTTTDYGIQCDVLHTDNNSLRLLVVS